MTLTSIVLAGGKNLRLGRNKALEPIGGRSLIQRVIERLEPLADRILIVTSGEPLDLPDSTGVEIVADVYRDKGPLGGIYTGLLASRTTNSIVVACDMPFLNTGLLRYMVGLSEGFDAVVPRLEEEMIEPLHAVYSRDCLSGMKIRLEQDRLGIHPFLNSVRVRYIEKAECQEIDPQLLSFFNINYQSDLDRALELADEGK